MNLWRLAITLIYFALLRIGHTQGISNLRPVIGILTQTPPDAVLEILEDKNYTSFVAASYIKYIESAGARVAPIFIDQDDAYYEKIASSVNGLLFPGGPVSITNSSGYGYAGQRLYDHVVKAYEEGIYIPIWGTCLGFQMLTYLSADRHDWLTNCNAENKADNLVLREGYMDSRIFNHMPQKLVEYAEFYNTTINFHQFCMTPENFTVSGLSKDYKLLATSYDFDGLEYVSLMEHETLPFYGSQFHPEKNQFEWPTDENHDAIPHQPFAVELAQYFTNFFVNQARYNNQCFPTEEEERDALIYNYNPIYTAALGSSYTQSYLFR